MTSESHAAPAATMAAEQSHAPTSSSLLLSLPTTLLAEGIGQFLTLSEERALINTCSWSCSILAQYLSIRKRILMIPVESSPSEPVTTHQSLRLLQYPPVLQDYLHSVVELDLTENGRDEILVAMHSFLPQLQTLSLVNSPHVTSVGIATLGTDANRCRNLQTLDITSCNNVRYGITLELRRQLQHANLVIRRQPVWMDGHFHTPYENDGVHTYWADGSFSFQRDDFNCGFVLQLWQWPSIPAVPISYECYGNRLQFCKFFPGLRSEPFTRYRPGVSLVQEPLENDHSLVTDTMNTGAANVDGARSNAITATGLPRTIVVFQSERDAPPPSAWPTPIPDCLSSAPVGETKRYDELMVTRMAVTPFLDTERCMPPIHLVQEIEAFLERQPTADQLDL